MANLMEMSMENDMEPVLYLQFYRNGYRYQGPRFPLRCPKVSLQSLVCLKHREECRLTP